MAKKVQPNLYGTLFVRPKYESGTQAYWIWELILFRAAQTGVSCGNLVGAGRFGSQKEAVKKAEVYAKLLGIDIDRRSIMG